MLRFLLLLAILYVVWCTTLYFLQDQIVFPGNLAPAPREKAAYPDAIELVFEVAPSTKVVGWFLPAPGCSAEHPAGAIIYFHGNLEIIDDQDVIVAGYHKLGCSVLRPEYRGYGRSDGRPSRDGIRENGIRFHDLLARRDDVDASRIVFHGRSLGGAVATDVTTHRKPKALILQSTFTSAEAVAHRLLVPGCLVRHRFDTRKIVAKLDIPVLVFHGTGDLIIPVRHGRKLRDAARQGTYVEYNCGHRHFPDPDKTPTYWPEIKSFLA